VSRRRRNLDPITVIFWLVAPIVAIFAFIYVGLPLVLVFAIVTLLTLGLLALAGSISGLIVGLRNFHQTTVQAHTTAGKRKPKDRGTPFTFLERFEEPQPARLNYMVDGGWFVMAYVLREVWAATREDADNWIEWSDNYLKTARKQKGGILKRFFGVWLYAAGSGIFIGGLFHFVAAFLIVLVFVLLLGLALTGGALISGLLVLVWGAVTGLYERIHHMHPRCPNCHEHMIQPVFICPHCERRHTRLRPNIYGIFHHRCDCGRELATIDWLGRRQYLRRCPNCDHVLSDPVGRATAIHIPIIGGPSAGKTHYIVAATQALITDYAQAHHIDVTMPDAQDRQDFAANVQQLNRGQQLRKTQVERDNNTRAYNLQIKRPRHPVPTLLYIYDGAGEYYTDQERTRQQVYLRYGSGFIMIVDPFTIERVYQQYKPRLATHGRTLAVNNDEPLSAIYERMLETLETLGDYSQEQGKRIPHPIAVVLTKADAFDLEDQIGIPAAMREIQQTDGHLTPDDAIDAVVRRFLTRHGEGNFVRNLQTQFETVRFFSCSSTGRMVNPTNHSPFRPVRILDPLLWLMAQNRVLPAQPPTLTLPPAPPR
jgi:hypothetical protein